MIGYMLSIRHTPPRQVNKVTQKLGVDSIKDLIALSAQRPDAINYATPGTGLKPRC